MKSLSEIAVAAGLPAANVPHIIKAEQFSQEQLSECRKALADIDDRGVALVALGSLARRECTVASDLFDASVVSAEVRAAKPDKLFWAALLEQVPFGSVFVDDQETNCRAAAEAGFRTIWAHPSCAVEERVDEFLSEDVEEAG